MANINVNEITTAQAIEAIKHNVAAKNAKAVLAEQSIVRNVYKTCELVGESCEAHLCPYGKFCKYGQDTTGTVDWDEGIDSVVKTLSSATGGELADMYGTVYDRNNSDTAKTREKKRTGNVIGIFELENGGYYWMDCLDDDDAEKARYFAYEGYASSHHVSKKSALYEDLAGYNDVLQNEESLADDELYIVTYFKFDRQCWGLEQKVDFGITKDEIIANVIAQKYVEGADYLTMSSVSMATRKEKKKIEAKRDNDSFDYYEIEFGVLADGAQTGDYEAGCVMCIKARHCPSINEAEAWLCNDMRNVYCCDCVHSITKISEAEAFGCYDMKYGDYPIFG